MRGDEAPRLKRNTLTLGRQNFQVAFLRFTLAARHPDSGVADGVFRTAYALRDAENVTPEDRAVLSDELSWFEEHLPTPTRLNRTTSKGHYRRNAKGIAWFRDTAAECIARMQ
jgi:hypothetical protein